MGTSQPTPPATTPTTTPTPEPDPTHVIKSFHVPARSYGDSTDVEIPKGSEVLEAVFFEGRVNVWAKCPIDAEDETHTFRIIGDGDAYAADVWELRGMALRPNGRALHIIERVS